MATFSFNGMDAIEASFQEMSQLSDEEKYSVIAPAAELLRQRFVEKIKAVFVQRSGKLAESLPLYRNQTTPVHTLTSHPLESTLLLLLENVSEKMEKLTVVTQVQMQRWPGFWSTDLQELIRGTGWRQPTKNLRMK